MTLTLAAVFLARLIQWQIVQSDMYRSMTDGRELYTVAGDAVRGEIFDVNGEPLAVNLTGRRIVMQTVILPLRAGVKLRQTCGKGTICPKTQMRRNV